MLLIFFLLSYALMWTCFLTVAWTGLSASSPVGFSLLLLGTFAPALSALTLTVRADGPAGVTRLLTRVVHPTAAARWYVFALIYMAAAKLMVAAAYRVGFGTWPTFGTEPLWLLPLAVAFSTPVQIGEELGWRGYALPRLAARFGLARASLILGVIWACWHLPQFFVRDADTYGQSFPMFFLEVVAMSVAMAWLYARVRGTLLPLMVMHAAVNNTKDIVPSATPGAADPSSFHASAVGWLTVAILWIAAAGFLTTLRSGAATPRSS